MEEDRAQRFVTKLQVRVTDLNYGGHLGNDRVLAFFHEARVQFLAMNGLSEKNIGEGVSLTQTEAFVQYKGEAFVGDILTCAVWVEEIGGARFRLAYKLSEAREGRLIAVGYTELAGFDYITRKIQRLPHSFKKILSNFLYHPVVK